MNTKSNIVVQTRRYRKSNGNFRIINIPSDRWMLLDWLIENYSFPVCELIDDVESLWGEAEFNSAFAHQVRMSYDAQIMVENNVANDNFLDPLF